MAWARTLRLRVPVITLSISGAALLTYLSPRLTELFVYERRAVCGGQLWRLLTAPFVHFSASHLCWNLLVFAAVGCLTEFSGQRRFGLVCALSAAIPGVLFLLARPELGRYGGLSAVATAATAYFCLCRARRASGGDRLLWAAMVALLLVKVAVEVVVDAPLFARSGGQAFRVLPSAHAVGVAVAVALFALDGMAGSDGRRSASGNGETGGERTGTATGGTEGSRG